MENGDINKRDSGARQEETPKTPDVSSSGGRLVFNLCFNLSVYLKFWMCPAL